MKVTQWFGPRVKPIHIGLYQATAFGDYDWAPMFYWNGKEWRRPFDMSRAGMQRREWRGLAEKPK